jgi:hypothetical protein
VELIAHEKKKRSFRPAPKPRVPRSDSRAGRRRRALIH